MFNCNVCKEAIGPGVSPIHVVTGKRDVSYHNEFEREDEWGNKEKVEVDSTGTEITGEALVCPPCAQVELVNNAPTQVRGAYSFQEELAAPFKVKLIASAVDRATDRIGHNSKRANRDMECVIPQLKSYLDANKGLI